MNQNMTVENKALTKNGIKRLFFAVLSILLEVGIWFLIVNEIAAWATWIDVAIHIFALFQVLFIYNRDVTSSVKLPWIILILAVPLFGVFLYLLVGTNAHTKTMKERYKTIDQQILPMLEENAQERKELHKKDEAAAGIAEYLYLNAACPTYHDSSIWYYNDASKGLDAQLEDLAKAEKFIFMEYHAIENAESWKRIQDVLEDRVRAGVEVRVFYDDMGSIGFIDSDFAKMLNSRGIQCKVFNPFAPGLNLFLNNRDHRKITVIDGKVGFTGGYNLANEYFNITHPYGQWKDTGVRISGPAVKNLTVIFLAMWNADKHNNTLEEGIEKYLPEVEPDTTTAGAFITPYGDSPMYPYRIGENVYINMASRASRYCWFITPYLILSDELSHAIRLAAARGVDVRIITPGIPDKKLVYSVTRSFYSVLVNSGVRIYEWTPGFCHAKMSIADDRMATCGTINLDYRSLYHHFENGCFFCECDAVIDMKHDFEHTFAQCTEVTDKYLNGSTPMQLQQMLLRLFSSLM